MILINKSDLLIIIEQTRRVSPLLLALARLAFIVLGIHQLGENLPGMAARVKVIRVRIDLAFAPLLTAMCSKDVLVVIVVEMLVLVDVRLGHSSRDSISRGRLWKGSHGATQIVRNSTLVEQTRLTRSIRYHSILVARRSPTRVYI